MNVLDIQKLSSPLSMDKLKENGSLITEKLRDNLNLIKGKVLDTPLSINNDILENKIIQNNNIESGYINNNLLRKLGYIFLISIIFLLLYSLYIFSNKGIKYFNKLFEKGKNWDLYNKKEDEDKVDDYEEIEENKKNIKQLDKDINEYNKSELIMNKSYEPDKKNNIINNMKKQWCYLGSDRGYRSCARIDENLCMSGKIFPKKDICINPNLRMN